jgi:asparagine synthase (glutamine-hydrolysing)
MRHNYIPAPYSIHQGIAKLEPGSLLSLSLANPEPHIWKYWDTAAVARAGLAIPFAGSAAQAVDELDKLARDAVRQQMMADVPLGAFLSGGIDSSTVVALMQSQSARPVKTFTIGFNEEGYNEAVHAKAVARHLGTEHTELYITPEQAMAVIPQLPTLYDEPFSDSSQIPTFLVSKMTKQHVTASLSGDAGDELFGGYNRYFGTQKWWNLIQATPKALRRSVAYGLSKPEPAAWDRLGQGIAAVSGNKARWGNFGNRMQKLAAVLLVEDSSSLYRHFVSHWSDPASVVIDGVEPTTCITQPRFSLDNIVEQMMLLDSVSYLPDDILVKVDRAAMGVSLETRVPFLDHRLVEFAWQLPLSLKVRDGQGKWVLRQVLYKYVPRELIERPKMGFGVPIDSWLRGPLRDWAECLLDESRLRREGFFNPVPIRQKWAEHLSGQRNWQYHLWDVLMFQAWLENESGSLAGRGAF